MNEGHETEGPEAGPTSERIRRRLATVLAADVASYSRLMSEDEEFTLRTLRSHRKVFDSMIARHDGRIANTAGDSIIAVFDSPVEAVRCAVEAQGILRERNSRLPEGKRVQFRVGINLGDIILNDHDVLGDGVNIAARLEGIAEPGAICISAAVREHIGNRLADVSIYDLGPQTLKNISKPVRAFDLMSSRARPRGIAALSERTRWWAVIGSAIAVIATALTFGVVAASSFLTVAKSTSVPVRPVVGFDQKVGAPGAETPSERR